MSGAYKYRPQYTQNTIGPGAGGTMSEQRKRPFTLAEAKVSAQRLINSHFHNPDSARVQIPRSLDDDDVFLMDFLDKLDEIITQAMTIGNPQRDAEIERKARLDEAKWWHWRLGVADFNDGTFKEEAKKHIAALEKPAAGPETPAI